MKNPVYVEHFFTDAERKDSVTIKKTIEGLVAQLELKDESYQAPETFYSRIENANKIKLDTANIHREKMRLYWRQHRSQDSINGTHTHHYYVNGADSLNRISSPLPNIQDTVIQKQ